MLAILWLGSLLSWFVPQPALALKPELLIALSKPAHTLSAQELSQLRADNTPKGLDAEVLLDRLTLRIDKRKRLVREHHVIYRVNTAQGVSTALWNSLQVHYLPWNDQKPKIRARVVTPDGQLFELDPATIVDSVAPTDAPGVFHDARQLAAPLPGLRPGAVVEQVTSVEEREPLFDAGWLHRVFLGRERFTSLAQLILEFPDTLKVESRARWGVGPPTLAKRDETHVITYSVIDRELSENPEARVYPFVDVGTGEGWGAVARSYDKAVDSALATFQPAKVLSSLLSEGDDPSVKLRKILAFVRREVRYTGLELGARAYVPTPPDEVLRRHYGDCKDQSALLVGLLRAAGFDAHVALLRTAASMDVFPDLSGFGMFDHAIVHVAAKPAIWIDPVSPYASPGALPFVDQERRALIASANTQHLVTTPRTKSEQSVREIVIRTDFPQLGFATVNELARASGALISEVRESWEKSPEQLQASFRDGIERAYGARDFKATFTTIESPLAVLELSFEVPEAKSFEVHEGGATVKLGVLDLYRFLPKTVQAVPNAERAREDRDEALAAKSKDFREVRRRALRVPVAHRNIIRYVLNAPAGFSWQGSDAPLQASLFGFHLTRSVVLNASQATVTMELDVKAEAVQPETLDRIRELFFQFKRDAPVTLRLVHNATTALSNHRVVEALAIHRALLAASPRDAMVNARYASDLLRMGFGAEARRVADRLVLEQPSVAAAHAARAHVYRHDELGRAFAAGALLVEAEKSLRKAMALAPEEPRHVRALARFLAEPVVAGGMEQERATEVVRLYSHLSSHFDQRGAEAAWLRGLLTLGNFQQVAKLAEAMPEAGPSAEQDVRAGVWVAAVFGQSGSGPAKELSDRLTQGNGRQALASAALELVRAGRYELARDLIRATSVHEELSVLEAVADAAARKQVCQKALEPASRAVYASMLPYLNTPNPPAESHGMARMTKRLRVTFQVLGDQHAALAGRVMSDALPCFMRWETEEKYGALRVRVTPASGGAEAEVFYLRKAAKGVELMGVQDRESPFAFGFGMRAALAEHRLDEARAWLRWARPVLDGHPRLRDRYDMFDALDDLWPKEPANAQESELALLAAAMVTGASPPEGRELLKRALESERNPGARRSALMLLTASESEGQDLKERSAAFATLHQERPTDRQLWERSLMVLAETDDHERLQAELEPYEKRYPGSEVAIELRNLADLQSGKAALMVSRTHQRLLTHESSPSELNNAAWWGLIGAVPPRDLIPLAQAACANPKDATPGRLDTLVTVLAESGDADATYAAWRKLIATPPWQMSSSYAYAMGKLAELLGLPDVARTAYQRVTAPDERPALSSFALAQRALLRLNATATGQPRHRP